MSGPRSSKEVTEARVIELLPLVSIMNERDIWQIVSKKDWNISKRTLERYLAQARIILKEETEKYKDSAISNAINNLQKLYQKAWQMNDIKTCLEVQKQINLVFGIIKTNVDVTSKDEKITGFNVIIGSPED